MIDVFLGLAAPEPGWWPGMCRFEGDLALAEADLGRIAPDDAAAIAAAATDLAAAGWAGLDLASAGSPAIPVVDAVRGRVNDDRLAGLVHHGATSQDVVDTAMMLVARGAVADLREALAGATAAAGTLAQRHRDTPTVARTLLQHARPTTFGSLATSWRDGLDGAAQALSRLRFPVQLAGPVGTLHDPDLLAALAARTGLDVPAHPWHAERGVVAELAGTLGRVAGAIAKPALDVVLLAQSDVGEVAEATPGGSSSMPHKRNPVAAVRARALAAEVPGLVATVLSAAVPELQRGAGTWQAEWAPLTRLLTATVAAAQALTTSLSGLHVDVDAMARNLGRNA